MEHADAVHRRKAALTFAFVVFAAAGSAQTPVTIRAGTMLDGKGGIQRNVKLTIEGSKILRVEPGAGGAVTYDLSSLTLMPGWIDTHVHLNGHFNKAGKADNRGESPAEYACAWKAMPGKRCRAVSRLCGALAPTATRSCAISSAKAYCRAPGF
jgi:hypothetical protein